MDFLEVEKYQYPIFLLLRSCLEMIFTFSVVVFYSMIVACPNAR